MNVAKVKNVIKTPIAHLRNMLFNIKFALNISPTFC